MSDTTSIAKQGMKASSLCETALYAATAAGVLRFLPLVRLGALIGAVVAVAWGVYGLVQLAAYQSAAKGIEPERGIARAAHNRSQKAAKRAFAGIAIAALLLLEAGWRALR